MFFRIFAALLLAGWSPLVEAATVKLPAGQSVLSAPAVDAFELRGGRYRVEMRIVPVKGQSFRKALRARTKVQPAVPSYLQLVARSVIPVRKGDVMHLRFSLRCLESREESGEGLTEMVVERAGKPWTKSVTYQARAWRKWQTFDVPFACLEDYEPQELQICFRLGYAPQVIEIGGVEFINYGKNLKVSDLPKTRIRYRGDDPQAAWRRQARERIDRIRKADLAIRVIGASGKPVKGAKIEARMKRHAFGFGTAVSTFALWNDDLGQRERYREEVKKLFNYAVMENALKWPPWDGVWGMGRAKAIESVDWLRDQGLTVRGHVLVWPSWRHVPKKVAALKNNPDKLRKKILEHIAGEVRALRGKLAQFDVINEPFDNHDLMDLLGDQVMVDWFREARKADPDLRLYLNDYSILAGGGGTSAHRDHFEKTLKFLVENGAPLDGIGMQGHFGWGVTPPADLLKILDRYAVFGKPVMVTEYDHNVTDEVFQGHYIRDFMTALFSHPAVDGMLMWGFWDGAHWHQNAPIYRRDWSLKPSGKIWKELIFNEWWTKAQGKTDPRGRYRVRGFKGDYEVTVRHRGRTKSVPVHIGPTGAKLVIHLD